MQNPRKVFNWLTLFEIKKKGIQLHRTTKRLPMARRHRPSVGNVRRWRRRSCKTNPVVLNHPLRLQGLRNLNLRRTLSL